MKIAIAGKGGTGKTTISALIVRYLSGKHAGHVLAVDADPNSNLGEALGERPEKTIGRIIDEVAKNPDKIPGGMTKDRYIEFEVQTIVQEAKGFDLLTMGKPEGPGCYCYVNNVLRGVLEKLVKGYDLCVIDNEAGLEHLARKTAGSADVLLIVSDPSAAGLRAARRINGLVDELNLKFSRRFLVVNRVEGKGGEGYLDKEEPSLEFGGTVPEDEEIARAGRENKPVFQIKTSSAAFAAVRDIIEKVQRADNNKK
ncbi:MAG: AAA family ATPase [Deltaproteobacteria bacterium]